VNIPHVDFFPSDWLVGTSDLSLEERGLYITACALIYCRRGPVTREHLRNQCPVHKRVFNRLLESLKALGKLTERDGLIDQSRCQRELNRARNRIESARSNGAKGGRPSKQTNCLDKAEGLEPPPTTHHLPKESPPTLSRPSPDDRAPSAGEGDFARGQAAPAEEEGDFKISEKWIEEARDERRRHHLPELDLHELGRQTINRWRHDPPRNRWLAWRGRALTATLNPSLVPSPHRFTEEEEARRQRVAAEMVAEIRAQQAAMEMAA